MKILAFGEVMMRMMPSNYKKLEQVDRLEFLYTGTGVNILSGLYQMGHDVYLTTTLPNNNVGKAASSHIRKLGIKDDYIYYNGNHIGVYFLEQGFGNRASQVTYLNRLDSSFGQSSIKDYDFSCLDGMDALHICGISLAMRDNVREIAFAFAKEAKKRNIKVIFDFNYRPSLWQGCNDNVKDIYAKMLELTDIVFAGYKDVTLLLGKSVDNSLSYEKQLEEMMSMLCKEYDIEVVFGTIRKDDSLQGYMISNGKIVLSDVMSLKVLDRIGGGDGFASGAIDGYLTNMEFNYLINYATASGILAHTTYGDSPIMSKDEIIDFIENGNIDIKR